MFLSTFVLTCLYSCRFDRLHVFENELLLIVFRCTNDTNTLNYIMLACTRSCLTGSKKGITLNKKWHDWSCKNGIIEMCFILLRSFVSYFVSTCELQNVQLHHLISVPMCTHSFRYKVISCEDECCQFIGSTMDKVLPIHTLHKFIVYWICYDCKNLWYGFIFCYELWCWFFAITNVLIIQIHCVFEFCCNFWIKVWAFIVTHCVLFILKLFFDHF